MNAPNESRARSSTYWVDLLQAQVYRLRGRYTTRIVEAGEGEPLLLLHGTGGHAENYARNIMPLSRHFRVFAMDFAWHGRSQTSGFDPEIIPVLVDQIRDVLDTLGISQAHVGGQSLGGWVAMRFALQYPARLRKLILTTTMGYKPDPGSVPPHPEQDMARLRENSLEVLRNPTWDNIRARLERIVHDKSLITDEAIAVRHAFYNDPDLNAVQQQVITHYLGGEAPQKHLMTDALAARIAAPTLVYWGDKNNSPPAVGARLASVIPGAKFYSAPDTGHWAQFENYGHYNREVLAFLLGSAPSGGKLGQ
ncbi:MAG: alpha/beta fold hydrolase [Betaproteobacteria bacterium]|nr:alpha/beta fold hydrolase [Betaproteobacteria bacterium]